MIRLLSWVRGAKRDGGLRTEDAGRMRRQVAGWNSVFLGRELKLVYNVAPPSTITHDVLTA